MPGLDGDFGNLPAFPALRNWDLRPSLVWQLQRLHLPETDRRWLPVEVMHQAWGIVGLLMFVKKQRPEGK